MLLKYPTFVQYGSRFDSSSTLSSFAAYSKDAYKRIAVVVSDEDPVARIPTYFLPLRSLSSRAKKESSADNPDGGN